MNDALKISEKKVETRVLGSYPLICSVHHLAMSSTSAQFSRHRRSKSYPPRNPPSSGITFTLSDHVTSCFTLCSSCFPCFPSFSQRSSESTSSDELDFPRDTLDSLLPAFGDNQNDSNDDAAAWGSDALSLRSQFGTSNRSSRERNPRGMWRSWLGRLIAGRGEHLNPEEEEEIEEEEEEVDDERNFLEDPAMGWQVEDQAQLLDDNEVDWDSNVDRRSRTISTPPTHTFIRSTKDHQPKEEENVEAGQEETEEEREEEWGAFSSAPLTRRSPNLTTSPSPSPPPLPSAKAYPISSSTKTNLTGPTVSQIESSNADSPVFAASPPSTSTETSSTSNHQSSESSSGVKKSSSPSNENEPMPTENGLRYTTEDEGRTQVDQAR